jgi:hypothetical protein
LLYIEAPLSGNSRELSILREPLLDPKDKDRESVTGASGERAIIGRGCLASTNVKAASQWPSMWTVWGVNTSTLLSNLWHLSSFGRNQLEASGLGSLFDTVYSGQIKPRVEKSRVGEWSWRGSSCPVPLGKFFVQELSLFYCVDFIMHSNYIFSNLL